MPRDEGTTARNSHTWGTASEAVQHLSTLFDSRTGVTRVAAGVVIQVDILEVDGVLLPGPLSVSASDSLSFDLINDPGIVEPWSNGLAIDFLAELSSAEIPFELGVTKAKVVIGDQLLAISEPNSIAFIAKKDFTINVEAVPEPTSLAMMMIAIAAYGVAFRRRIFRAIF